MEHSTIIYETLQKPGDSKGADSPLLRLAWNKQDPNYLATFQLNTGTILILDIRVPSTPVTQLNGHGGAVNSIAWAPHSSGHLCSAGLFK